MPRFRHFPILTLLLWTALPSWPQAPAPSTAPAPCSTPEYRQFDFWLGEWDVQGGGGQMAGTNRIEKIQNGCALQETWHGADGETGTSFNMYNATTQRWHQTWVSGKGMLLLLDGGLQDGKMVLSGERRSPQGAPMNDRITWTKIDADHVRQDWDISLDGGKTWKTGFSGLYARQKPVT